ncbi:unnamed protein product [Symbiodinium pilosum]|uniref:RRM domain-containing protein n=1 Tax=Symbiodinium pilosum TaxID=2952 RepID=A0A812RED5_SYMPI|nr:unnamed protein product [Symbiodinium pilosum]
MWRKWTEPCRRFSSHVSGKSVASWAPRIRLRGLPFSATEADICTFLQGFELAEASEGPRVQIIRRCSDNLPTGHAFVYFKDWQVKTGEWLDLLLLCKVLQYWQLGVLSQASTRLHSELEAVQHRLVWDARGLRRAAGIQSMLDESLHAFSSSRVCFGAWARTAALLTAQKVGESAQQHARDQHALSLKQLSLEKAKLADAVSFSMSFTCGAADAADPNSAARLLVRRCFPWWRRQAAYTAARQRLLRREASNLKLQEDVRRHGEVHQLRWASWAANSKLCRESWRILREAFQAWGRTLVERPAGHDAKALDAAELVLSRLTPLASRVVFVAWRRLSQEEKVMSLEADARRLEAKLARAACEDAADALSLQQLEKRLAFQDHAGQQVCFDFEALQTQRFEQRLRSFTFGMDSSQTKYVRRVSHPT